VCATLAVEPKLRELVPAGWEKWLLDMVALATVADMVSLRGENRVLVKYGLMVMRKSPRIGLQKLCRVIRLEQNAITEDDIGFSIAPRINAASRIGEAFEAFRLLSTSDENEAETLAKKLEKLNRQRKAESGAITRAVHARLKERSEIRSVIALGDPEWRPALLGLVANTIADEFERPVFLWGREGNLRLKGSMRSGGPTHAIDLMRAAGDVFIEFGGHAAAGGFTVNDELVFSLEDRLVEAFSKLEQPDALDSFLQHADAEISETEVTPVFLQKLERLSPFGMQNEKPVFLLREWIVKDISRFGKGEEHLKLKIASPLSFGRDIDAVTFFAKGALARAATEMKPGSYANLIGHLERDAFSRKNPVRLRLLDLKLL
jgi:single-stranded-DNA-specific exonuclease